MFDPVIDNPFERFKAFFIGLFLLVLGFLFITLFKVTGNTSTYDDKVINSLSMKRLNIKEEAAKKEVKILTSSEIKGLSQTLLNQKPSALVSPTTKTPQAK